MVPYLSAGAEYTFKRTDTSNNATREWNQLDTRIGLNIPLDLSGGRFFRNLNLEAVMFSVLKITQVPIKTCLLKITLVISRILLIIASRYKWQDSIFIRGWVLIYRCSIVMRSRNMIAINFLLLVIFICQGFFFNHSVVLDGAFQERDTSRALFSNRFPYSRGYNETYLSRMWKLGANYHFPIWVPDWGFGNILYIQRYSCQCIL
jgi:hypothetical protein